MFALTSGRPKCLRMQTIRTGQLLLLGLMSLLRLTCEKRKNDLLYNFIRYYVRSHVLHRCTTDDVLFEKLVYEVTIYVVNQIEFLNKKLSCKLIICQLSKSNRYSAGSVRWCTWKLSTTTIRLNVFSPLRTNTKLCKMSSNALSATDNFFYELW